MSITYDELKFKQRLQQQEPELVNLTSPTPPPPEEFGSLEVLKAAFVKENTIGSTIANWGAGNFNEQEEDPDYDVVGKLEGTKYEQFADSFIGKAYNDSQFNSLATKIDREQEANEVLESAGGFGIAASIGAAILDPINLIPIGGTAYKSFKAGKTLQGITRGAEVGFLSEATTETILQTQQETRTIQETTVNIAGGAILGGMMGGFAAKLSRADFDNISKRVENDIQRTESQIDIGNDGSLSAARVDRNNLGENDLAGGKITQAVIKSTAKLNPMLRVFTSSSEKGKELIPSLVRTNMYFKKNFNDIATDQSVEIEIKSFDAGLGKSIEGGKSIYKQFNKRLKKETGKPISIENFYDQVSLAMIRGDKSDIPEVEQVAKIYRKEVFDPLKEQAIETGLLPKDIEPKTATSYLMRKYNINKMISKEKEFKDIIRRGARERLIPQIEKELPVKFKNLKNIDEAIDTPELDPLIKEASKFDNVNDFLDSIPPKEEALTGAMAHRPTKTGATASNITQEVSDMGFPEDFYKNPQYYEDINDPAVKESFNALMRVRNDPNAIVTIYRASPVDDLRNGDWVTLSKEYAKGESLQEGVKVHSFKVRAKDIEFAGDSINEFGYWGHSSKNKEQLIKTFSQSRVSLKTKTLKPKKKFNIDEAIDKIDVKLAKADIETKAFDNLVNEKLSLLIAKGDEQAIDDYVDQIADSVFNNIRGTERMGVSMPYDIKVGVRGPAKERLLTFVKDEELRPFLETDITKLAKSYTRTMATDVALKRKFGDLNLKPQIKEISREYDELRSKTKTEKERMKLDKEEKDILRIINALKDVMRGDYGRPNNPDGFFVKAAQVSRTINYMSKLGGVALSSVPDTGRHIMVHGMSRTFGKGLKTLVANTKAIKLSAKDAKLAGQLWESVTHQRASVMADLGNPYNGDSKFMIALDWMGQNFSKVNLLDAWNNYQKGFSSLLTQSRLIKNIRNFDNLKPKEKSYMAFLGIDKNNISRLKVQISKNSFDEDGFPIANLEKWTDDEALRLYKNALNTDVDRTIVTKGVGDVPLLMNTELGKTIFQFKSFAFAAHQQVTIAGLQQADAAAVTGITTMISAGMLAYYLKAIAAGREISNDPDVWIAEGIDRSGLMPVLMEINGVADLMGFGAGRLTGQAPLSRFASRNKLSGFLGPSFGAVDDVRKVSSSIARGELTDSDVRAIRRNIPFQNLFYLRQMFDNLEK